MGIFFMTAASAGFANTKLNNTDTSRKAVLTSVDKKVEKRVILQEANIVYPDILLGNEAESIDYVEKFSAKRKDYLIRTYNRSKKMFPKVENIFKKHQVPLEFKVLLALESNFNGNAVSSAGAVGYWQIMDPVAKEYGLKIPARAKAEVRKTAKASRTNKKNIVKRITVDERKNFNKSTNVAARYLKDRSRNLDNDWLLIAASYNCGVGNVWNAIEKSGKKSPSFWDIKKYLPAETRAYVMNFITLNVIFHNYDAFAKNTLCFKDITLDAPALEENSAENLSASLIE